MSLFCAGQAVVEFIVKPMIIVTPKLSMGI
jgi:hypothetical protein